MSLRPTLRTPDRRRHYALEDGRRLAWSEWGPVDGSPVLFCTGAATSGSLGLDAAAVADAGILLVAIDRPGLGRSSPHPPRTLDSWSMDVAQTAHQVGWSQPRAIGFSQGGPFALALAAAGVVEHVALVSAQDDLHAHINVLDEHVADLVRAVRANPAAVEGDMSQVMTAETYLTIVQDMSSPLDRAIYTSPSFDAHFSTAVREAHLQGAAGCARDLVIAMGPWPFVIEAIRVPIDIWYGEHDASPVHSPDLGESLSKRLPRSHRRVVTAAGGSLLWTHTADVLHALQTNHSLDRKPS